MRNEAHALHFCLSLIRERSLLYRWYRYYLRETITKSPRERPSAAETRHTRLADVEMSSTLAAGGGIQSRNAGYAGGEPAQVRSEVQTRIRVSVT